MSVVKYRSQDIATFFYLKLNHDFLTDHITLVLVMIRFNGKYLRQCCCVTLT